MDLQIAGRRALVTGGTRGIGLAIAEELAREGCRVAVCARSNESLERVRGRFAAIAADVSKEADAARAVAETVRELGGIDILVNNAGGSLGGGGFTESTVEQWRGVLDVNLMGTLYASKAAVSHMKSGRWGRIVNITSIWGRESGGGAAYNAAKAAVTSLTKAMAQDLAQYGILVNSVAPGSIWFEGGGWDRKQKADPGGIADFVDREFPLKRFGAPVEVAAVVALLASERASLVSGASWVVDGSQGRSNL